MPANGYIPEGGVWTAEERQKWRLSFIKSAAIEGIERDIETADRTVAALIAALEHSHKHKTDKPDHETHLCPICLLLEALR